MALFWFLAGAVSGLAMVVLLAPLLRTVPGLGSLPAVRRPAMLVAAAILLAVASTSLWVGRGGGAAQAPASAAAGGFNDAVKVFDGATATGGAAAMPGAAVDTAAAAGTQANAGSMDSAIANLEARLAKGGGSPGDWELLAKAYEFLGRPADAAKARAHQLPPPPGDDQAAPSAPAQAPAGTTVRGEIDLAGALARKAKAGETLFVFATSVDSPGPPVAVFRTSVGRWPLKFQLDDSQSMMPGRNLSSAGRVKIEARISASGQPLPTAGDLEGSTAALDPTKTNRPVKIVINRVVS